MESPRERAPSCGRLPHHRQRLGQRGATLLELLVLLCTILVLGTLAVQQLGGALALSYECLGQHLAGLDARPPSGRPACGAAPRTAALTLPPNPSGRLSRPPPEVRRDPPAEPALPRNDLVSGTDADEEPVGDEENDPDSQPGEQRAESDERSGIGRLARGALGLVIELSPAGDIRTLMDPEASTADQVVAVVSLVGTFTPFAPFIKAGATAFKVGKAVKKTEKAADELAAANKTGSKAPKEPPPAGEAHPCQGPFCRNGACFAAGTSVHTQFGLRPIEQVREGDLLWSRDEQTGATELRPVLHRFVTPNRALLRIELEGGSGASEELRVTPPHPFWTVRGWVAAEDLDVDDRVLLVSGDWASVASAEELDAGETVYNFEVGEFHTYFVGDVGAWVHNANKGPRDCPEAAVRATFDERMRNFNRRIEPKEIRGSPPARPRGSAGHAYSKHKIDPEGQAKILNDPERIFTGFYENPRFAGHRREVDIYYKDESVVITEAGKKGSVITAYGKEGKKGTPVNVARWSKNPDYVEIKREPPFEVVFPNKDRWHAGDWPSPE